MILDTGVKFSILMVMNKPSPRLRATKDLWLDAAYDLFIGGGIDAVKIMPLAKHLNLTRTGFYWHFADIAELHDAIIARWESTNTDRLVMRCAGDAPTICAALFDLMDCWLDPTLFDAKFDLAIRNWARVDKGLRLRLDNADMRRIAAVEGMFRRFGFSGEQAEVRALTVIYTQIGYISMDVAEPPQARLAKVAHYVELFAGQTPTPEDVNTFVARHQRSFI